SRLPLTANLLTAHSNEFAPAACSKRLPAPTAIRAHASFEIEVSSCGRLRSCSSLTCDDRESRGDRDSRAGEKRGARRHPLIQHAEDRGTGEHEQPRREVVQAKTLAAQLHRHEIAAPRALGALGQREGNCIRNEPYDEPPHRVREREGG